MEDRPGNMRVAPEHDAPPPYRPLSALAVSAMVAAILPGAFALGGLWWLAAPGLILGTLAWSLLADGRKRGRGLALFAAIASIVLGVVGFAGSRAVADEIERALGPFVRALSAPTLDETARKELEDWTEPAAGPGATDRWRERLRAAGAGEKLERLEVGSVWLGPLAMFIVPRDVTEVAPTGAAPPAQGEAIWVRAHFSGGEVWLALVPEGKPEGLSEKQERMQSLFESLQRDRSVRLHDVRVFRPVD